ncbi:hypothetical protein AB656_04150 [Bifidobacterium actinocoloniiforme DSM 22766]|nr:hypothetical protein AB656_04150 [Bifidobacterium actinocoloniiforme DSM 22766]
MNLSTSEGQLNISIPNADDMILVDVGYYINIHAGASAWTQVRIEHSEQTGTNKVTVQKMFSNESVKNIGTFDVDKGNNNALNVSVPSSEITGDQDLTWNAALDMNGKDLAFCPAHQEDKVPLQ